VIGLAVSLSAGLVSAVTVALRVQLKRLLNWTVEKMTKSTQIPDSAGNPTTTPTVVPPTPTVVPPTAFVQGQIRPDVEPASAKNPTNPFL